MHQNAFGVASPYSWTKRKENESREGMERNNGGSEAEEKKKKRGEREKECGRMNPLDTA